MVNNTNLARTKILDGVGLHGKTVDFSGLYRVAVVSAMDTMYVHLEVVLGANTRLKYGSIAILELADH